MFKIQFLLFIVGSIPLWALAEEASTIFPDELTTADSNDGSFYKPEDHLTVLPTKPHSIPENYNLEELLTPESTLPDKETPNSTDPNVHVDQPDEVGGEPKTSAEKEGLETVTLVGIIVGIILAIGIVAGIIIAVVRKMSGRYSP
ncbi:podoplanin isoform X2 [Ornithorhynchus anatinus]|uniref:podoplanin isoform X2 n=1 Tax=Ornithorhynchus anatinus TaxID=9258 RepID=UPI000454A1D5|nr:podoplanin isoform X2 [Ornithorhynchus anatinus]